MQAEEYVWRPPEQLVENSNATKFIRQHGFRDYAELVRRAADDVEWFWKVAAEELRVEWFQPYEKLLDLSDGIEWAKWFLGGTLNVAHNALDRHANSTNRNRLAFIWLGEDGAASKYTYGELYIAVNKLANALWKLGVAKGDVVATYLPMLPESVISLFATLKLGALFLPIFSGFGPQAITTRIMDSGAKILITADSAYRRGREIPLKPIVEDALAGVNNVRVVVKKRTTHDVPWKNERDVWWDDVCENQPKNCLAEQVDSEHPALLLYTSGTTGKPKGAVLSHVGAVLQPSKEIYFNLDLKESDIFMWTTDMGWMMGPWQVIGVQHHGGTHLIFEGAVDYPPDRIWNIVEKFQVTQLGGSATVFRQLKGQGNQWLKKHDLSSLRILGNTGEPLDKDTWFWLLKEVGKERCPIINLSGGTEILGCFLLPSPVVPLKPSTLWGPGLGMDVDVVDDDGRPVRGRIGHLVCKKPAPSMTRGFWKNPKKYIETYWSKWPKVWYHGDWASVDKDGYWFLHGRADDVIKIAGKRLGPAEVESVLDQHRAVRESAAIGIPHEVKGEALVCLVCLKTGHKPSDELKKELMGTVVSSMGKAFAPKEIVFVRDLPKNRAGKIMRTLIRSVLLDAPLGDISIVENPDTLEEIRKAINGAKGRSMI